MKKDKAIEVGAELPTSGPLVINRTRKEIGRGDEELFHPGDCGHFTKEDVAALHYHARQHGHTDDSKLQFRVHSPFVLGVNALCWGSNAITPELVQRILIEKGWPDEHLVGVSIVYDDNTPADEFHLGMCFNGEDVQPLGMVKTNFKLFQKDQEGPA